MFLSAERTKKTDDCCQCLSDSQDKDQRRGKLGKNKYGFELDEELQLFLSLARRSNALMWLDLRSFLLIEGLLASGEQELPLLFLMMVSSISYFVFFIMLNFTTCIFVQVIASLAGFISWRVYFIDGVPYESILWNGAVVFLLICLIPLVRILITAFKFEELQREQMRLLGTQKLWMRCKASKAIGYPKKDLTKWEHIEPSESNRVLQRQLELVPENAGDVSEAGNRTSVLKRLDKSEWYTYNFEFLDDAMFLVQQQDVFPRFFGFKLNAALAQAIVGVFFSSLFTGFKVLFG